jgi:pyroglutamyl-peptidase
VLSPADFESAASAISPLRRRDGYVLYNTSGGGVRTVKMAVMHIIFTGFDAFDGSDVNPSQVAVERLDRGLLRDVGVPHDVFEVTHTLVTCCNEAWAKVQAEVRAVASKGEDFALILTGMAGNRDRICLERFALNVRAYRIDDNHGHRWQEEYIDSTAPDALRCQLPLFKIVEELEHNGVRADISNYAGTFVCNETYFRAMQKWQQLPNCKGIIFVHVPQPIDYVGTNPDKKVPENIDETGEMYDKAISEFRRAFAIIAKCVVQNAREGNVGSDGGSKLASKI